MRGANNQPQIHSKPLDCLTAHSSRCTLPCLFAEWARCLIHGPLFFCPALLSAFTAKMAARGLMRTDVFLLCLPGWRRLRSSPAKFNGACPTTTGFLCVIPVDSNRRSLRSETLIEDERERFFSSPRRRKAYACRCVATISAWQGSARCPCF